MGQRNVHRGAAKFDLIDPDWYNKIDISILALSDPEDCIIGQLYGDYRNQDLPAPVKAMKRFSWWNGVSSTAPEAAWADEIQSRRHLQAQVEEAFSQTLAPK